MLSQLQAWWVATKEDIASERRASFPLLIPTKLSQGDCSSLATKGAILKSANQKRARTHTPEIPDGWAHVPDNNTRAAS